MQLKAFFFLTVLAMTLRVTLTLPSYDINQALELYFTVSSGPIQEYALFMTAQSTFEANFFRFSPNQPQFPSLITISQLSTTTKTITLKYRNIFTNAQAIAAGIDTTSCVSQTSVNCITNPSAHPICEILTPLPSQDGIMRIELKNQDCSVANASPLCQLRWNHTDLINTSDEKVFISSNLLCPGAVIQVPITVSVLKANINKPYMAGPGSLSFHYHTVSAADPNSWMMTGSMDRLGEPSEVCTNSSEPLVILSDSNSTELGYNTIIKTRLMRHNHTADVYCKYELNYTGIVRGIFINDYPSGVHAPSGIGLDTETRASSSLRLMLRANQFNYVNIFGYNMTKTDIKFTDCQASWNGIANPSIPVEFFTYSYGEPVAVSEDFQTQGTTSGCGGDCLRCTDRGFCIKCATHLFQARCEARCPKDYPFPDYKNICNAALQAGAVMLEPYDEGSGKTTITFFNDYVTPNPYVIMLYSGSKALLAPGPLAWPSGVNLLAESLATFVPTLEFEVKYGVTTIPTTMISAEASEGKIFFPRSTTLNSGELKAMYYPLISTSSLLYIYYDMTNEPTTDYQRLTYWKDISTLSNTGYLGCTEAIFLLCRTSVVHMLHMYYKCTTNVEHGLNM